ncbi:MAG: hypothetical protein ACWA40_06090 [Planktomarina sp.]
MIKSGWSIFIETIQMALSLGSVILRSALFQVLFFVLVGLFIEWSDVFSSSYLYWPIYIVISLWLIGTLAVRVHRAAIMGPDGLVQGIHGKLENAYIWRWLRLAVPIFLVFFMGVYAMTALYRYVYKRAFEYGDIQLFQAVPFEITPVHMLYISWFVFAVLTTVMFGLFMAVFYRCAMGLPHIACGRGWITWGQSLRATAGMSAAIVFASIFAAFCSLWIITIFDALIGWTGLAFVKAPIYVLHDIILILAGACFMNVIYQRSDADVHSDQGAK